MSDIMAEGITSEYIYIYAHRIIHSETLFIIKMPVSDVEVGKVFFFN